MLVYFSSQDTHMKEFRLCMLDYILYFIYLANNQFVPLLMLMSVSNPIMLVLEKKKCQFYVGHVLVILLVVQLYIHTREQIGIYPLNSHIFALLYVFTQGGYVACIELELGNLSSMEFWWKWFIHRILIPRVCNWIFADIKEDYK